MQTTDTNLATIIDRIDANWADFRASYAGLSDEEMLIHDVSGDWSVRDILAHGADWDALVLSILPGILETGRHPEHDEANADLDAYNARMTEETRHLSLDEVRRELEDTHRRLLDYLGTVDADGFAANAAFRKRLAADTWDHYPEHTAAIRAWRERRS
ncbi:MAG TPA: ClbS/DfsB family four-helix bundle protein [Thermomicrobiales bacterium]|nr:ClbS/DfsB family four-helix bundle protein [Thermomicrobiales bacterium]